MLASIGLLFVLLPGPTGVSAADTQFAPTWLYPLLPPAPATRPPFDDNKPIHIAHSDVSFTEAGLNNFYSAPDWFPASHGAMPEVVSHGRNPGVYACAFCHEPSGQGRPENAALAGLPAAYIRQQIADMKSGARRSGAPAPYRPSDLMMNEAQHASDADIADAAEYFSRQRFESHVRVVEAARVPRSRIVGWVYTAISGSGAGDEPLDGRLMEFTPDPERHEHRDDNLVYTAYVPPGSVARGRALALGGTTTAVLPCVGCHGSQLQGTALVPRLAGRSPTYLLRQLVGFKSGARAGVNGALMRQVVANLQLADMIDVAAYAASQQP